MKIPKFNIKWHLLVFPILALCFSLWYLKKFYDAKGSEIKVSFSDAKSIQPEKTKVFYRGVMVGLVKEISISEDGKKAIAHIALQKSFAKFAVEGTKFYLVSPRIGFSGVSGLETLISGSYISVAPGKEKNSIKKDFTGELSTLKNDIEENTSQYILETEHAESVSVGDPISYRGLEIGEVSDLNFNKSGQIVVVKINIKNKFVKLIRTNTVFWKKQGIQADFGLFGSDIKINSLDTILRGGIEIATPNNIQPIAKYGSKFILNNDPPKELKKEKWTPDLSIEKNRNKSN